MNAYNFKLYVYLQFKKQTKVMYFTTSLKQLKVEYKNINERRYNFDKIFDSHSGLQYMQKDQHIGSGLLIFYNLISMVVLHLKKFLFTLKVKMENVFLPNINFKK